jgi:hypothetical protein
VTQPQNGERRALGLAQVRVSLLSCVVLSAIELNAQKLATAVRHEHVHANVRPGLELPIAGVAFHLAQRLQQCPAADLQQEWPIVAKCCQLVLHLSDAVLPHSLLAVCCALSGFVVSWRFLVDALGCGSAVQLQTSGAQLLGLLLALLLHAVGAAQPPLVASVAAILTAVDKLAQLERQLRGVDGSA